MHNRLTATQTGHRPVWVWLLLIGSLLFSILPTSLPTSLPANLPANLPTSLPTSPAGGGQPAPVNNAQQQLQDAQKRLQQGGRLPGLFGR